MKRHIPNFLTCCNMMVGSLGIVWVISEKSSDVFWFVLIAAVFDFLDGFSARILKVQSEIGKQLDSLADLISFGMLPACAMVTWQFDQEYVWHPYANYLSLILVPFSALRLAKFNVSTNQSKEFVGLPTPANAIMLATLLSFSSHIVLNSVFFVLIIPLSCFLLVSKIRMIALKFSHWNWKENKLRYSLILLVVIGLTVFKFNFIPFVIPTYILISILGNKLSNPLFIKCIHNFGKWNSFGK